MKSVEWSEILTEKLTRLWIDGASAAEIGKELGVTRNSVLGKVHRLGLEQRAPTPIRFQSPERRREIYASRARERDRIKKEKKRAAIKAKKRAIEWSAQGLSKTSPTYRDQLPRIGTKTRNELREMLAQAVRNTAEARV